MEEFLNPEKVLTNLELKKDMVAADFGSGSGGFVFPLAKKLEDGLVYALDVQGQPLSALKSRALFERVQNIRIIRCNLEGKGASTLPEDSLDLVLMINFLFQVEDKNAILKEAKKVLRRGGKILVVDWLPKASQGPEKGRISAEDVKKLAKKSGLTFEKEFKAGIYHYGLVFKKD